MTQQESIAHITQGAAMVCSMLAHLKQIPRLVADIMYDFGIASPEDFQRLKVDPDDARIISNYLREEWRNTPRIALVGKEAGR